MTCNDAPAHVPASGRRGIDVCSVAARQSVMIHSGVAVGAALCLRGDGLSAGLLHRRRRNRAAQFRRGSDYESEG